MWILICLDMVIFYMILFIRLEWSYFYFVFLFYLGVDENSTVANNIICLNILEKNETVIWLKEVTLPIYESFSKKTSEKAFDKASRSLDLIHPDICGLMKAKKHVMKLLIFLPPLMINNAMLICIYYLIILDH